MRYLLCGAAFLGLVACEPSVPDSGVGFGNYSDYRKQQEEREAALRANPLPAPMAVSEEQLDPSRSGVSGTAPVAAQTEDEAERIAAETAAALNSGQAPVQASPANPAPVQTNHPGISSENDFQAVSEERSIDADAERLAQIRAQYEVVQPTAVPTRTGGDGASIVEYALRTSNPVGTAVYKRNSLINTQARADRNCLKYPSPDMAQTEFLKRGGPERDRLGLDPDGDGFACSWDPRPFRKAAGG